MSIPEALALAIVEGLTEYLPVSSTGHMIIASSLMGIASDDFTKIFTVNIQFGAILAVVVLYWKRFFQSMDFYYKLLAAFIPAAVIGFLFGDEIDALLENVVVVASALIAGGVFLLFADRLFAHTSETQTVSFQKAFKIGFFQCLALVPGVSRSAATIIGGMSQGLTRKMAAEFSFFLAVPTMFAASAYKLLKNYKIIEVADIGILALGNAVAFIVALFAVKLFVELLTRYGFKWFGVYRILAGGLILLLLAFGVDLKVV